MNSNFFGNMIMFWFALVVIGIIIFIALIVAIFEMNSNIKSIKDYLLRNELLEGRRLEPQEEWIYEDKKKTPVLHDNNEDSIVTGNSKRESIWNKKIF